MNKLTWSQSPNQHMSMHVTLPNIKDIEGKPWNRFTISEELKALLIKQGWTPPCSEPQPAQQPDPLIWMPIETAPKRGEFLVGCWVGEFGTEVWAGDSVAWGNIEQVGWLVQPKWEVALSHDDTDEDFRNDVRGWNHRNGPFRGAATHWASLPKAPNNCLPVIKENT